MTPADWLALVGTAALLVVLLVLSSKLARAGVLAPESARKLVHTGMGLTCLAFPWIFSGPVPVVTLATMATCGLLAVRLAPGARQMLGASLHGVGRRSSGELLFPVAVAAVFVLAGPRREFFLIPVLVLTVADALGAMVASPYATPTYHAWKGSKSMEGSFLVFLSAFLCCHLVLLLGTPAPREACVWIAVSVALLATAVEGALGDGWDNLLVPLGTYLVLDQLDGRSVGAQAAAAAVFCAMFGVLWQCRRWSSLDGGALLAGLLYGAACLAWGGYVFLAGPLALFGLHLLITRRLAGRRRFHHAADTVLFLALPVLGVLALHHGRYISREIALAGHTAAIAAQVAMIHAATRRELGLARLRPWFGFGKAGLFVMVPALALQPQRGMAASMALVALVLPWLMWHEFRHHSEDGSGVGRQRVRRAALAALAAGLAMAPGFIV